MGEGNGEALPETVTIGGVVFMRTGPNWYSAGDSYAFRYATDFSVERVRGQWACGIRLGTGTFGGVEPTLEKLDEVVSEQLRSTLLPLVDLLLRRANSARLHGDNAQADALMHELEAVAMRIPLASNAVVVDEDTRRALPDACDVDEPAVGDAFSAAYEARERVDDDRSPTGADVFTGVAS